MGRSMSLKELSERVGKCANTTKVVLGVCYVLIFVLGLALCIAGAVARSSESALQTLHVPGIASLPTWGICLGVFLALVALVGALGSFLLNRPLLIIFACLTAVLIVVQVSVGVTAYVRQDKFPVVVNAAWNNAENSTRAYLETTFECCGLENTTDRAYLPGCPGYASSSFSSSAASASSSLALDETVSSSLFNGGCMAPILALAYRVANKVGAALLGITAFEVLTLIVTAVLLCRIRKAKVSYSRMDADPVESLLR